MRSVFHDVELGSEKPLGESSYTSDALSYHDSSHASPKSSLAINSRSLIIQVAEAWCGGKPKDDVTANPFERLSFHNASVDKFCRMFDVSPERGLDSETAARNIRRDGKNTIITAKP
ncbi:hypothetical protein H0H93_010903, partial [Arthromyces matolae]